MRTLETGQEKIQKICDTLRRETLEPAQNEAQQIVADAKKHAEQIIHQAHQEAEKLVSEGRRSIEQERNVFHSSLSQAAKQSVEALKQEIEQKLFNEELHQLVQSQTADPKILAKLIDSIVKAIENEGLAADLTAIIPASVSVKDVNALLSSHILHKLKNQSVTLGDISGGVRIRLENKRMTLDVSDVEIEHLLRRYLRKDFRKMVFGESGSK